MSQEFADLSGNFGDVRFQREVASVVEMNLCLRLIPLEGLGAGRQYQMSSPLIGGKIICLRGAKLSSAICCGESRD